MAVTLTIAEVNGGGNFSDTLAGLSVGMDIGQSTAGQWAPLVSQSGNQGHQDLIVKHDAVVDPVTSVKLSIAQFSGVYGGVATAALDFATITAYGVADAGATTNNADGLSRGLHIDMDWAVATLNQFGYTREAAGNMRIYGKNYSGLDGLTVPTAFALHVDSCSYWNGLTETDASVPVTGSIGKFDDTVLGNQAHIRARFYLHSGETTGGILQWDTVFTYAFTS